MVGVLSVELMARSGGGDLLPVTGCFQYPNSRRIRPDTIKEKI